ncbi:serine/threonine-protein kinase tousled [Phtheirospermum japonicum]|uniref:Serine/threonine-protein kinase tousled n=1 Tax=Phtheirospermum japonicum TaxID=374723 RepID=A0A830BRL8_9LAMI|nr:serine/threonine-protein kinase tousled [Phtheirospermum japonicum]
MSDDMILHFSSNSSNQSDQSSKIAKLEARLVGRPSSAVASQPQAQAQLSSWSAPSKYGAAPDNLPESLIDSDDSDDDNGGAFLILANTQKRRKVDEDCSAVGEHVEDGSISGNVHQAAAADARQKTVETMDTTKGGADDEFLREQLGHDSHSSTEDEATSLRAKVVLMGEELKKSREEAADYRNKCEGLEKEVKDFKDYEQQMKPKRIKVLSDLLISVSKAERHEARTKVRQDSLRLGNVGVIRAGTVISEAWEDGQALKDLNAHLAFDMVEHRYVACKLHGLNAQWSEEKKQSYIRHAIREYNIHKTLIHHHIVRLWDIFEIDHNTFCTVLEYCSGKDLDAVLKATPILSEREARIIIVQIFQGLVYLNKRSQKIIHYDLKPGNVLFDEIGVAKVTDFGLSKIVEDDVGYLPPECFELNKTPLISSKEFIRRCLTYNQADRPDVLTIAQDPYLNYIKK